MSPTAFRKRLLPAVLLTLAGVSLAAGATLPSGLPRAAIPVKSAAGGSLSPADSIVANTTLTRDKIWILKGFVVVKKGITLTIEPGAFIVSDAVTKGTLIVDRGGYLVAAGTRESPITFTGPTEERGSWGGIALLGKGVSNQGYDPSCPSCPSDVAFEAINWAFYGGNDDNDSSGVLTYVRIENAGFPVDVDREMNGLTLAGVGSRTLIHHLQVDRSDDDGIEFFGGAVNADHLIVTRHTDDGFDIDHGYHGSIDYMIDIQRLEPGRPRPGSVIGAEPVGDNGIECGSSQGELSPRTHPHWSHITIIDNGKAFGPFQAKEDCGGTFEKMVLVAGGAHPDSASVWGININGPQTLSGLVSVPPRLEFKDVFLTGNWRNPFQVDGPAGASLPPSDVAAARVILDGSIRQLPFAATGNYGLNKDLSPADPGITAAGAGAIVAGDLWYQDWTLPGTVDFPLGGPGPDPVPRVYAIQTQVRQDRALLSYCPINGGWALLQYPGSLSLTDSSGRVLWTRESGSGWQGAQVRPTLDGGMAVAAIDPLPTLPRALLTKLDALGNIVFQKTFDSYPGGNILDFAQSPDSGYLFSVHRTLTSGEQARLFKVDKLGNAQWEKTFEGDQVRANSVKATADTGFVLGAALRSAPGTGTAAELVKLDAAGRFQVAHEATAWGHVAGWDAEPTPDGGYLLAGEAFNPSGELVAGLVKVGASGNRAWSVTFPRAAGSGEYRWTGALSIPGGTALLGFRGGLTLAKVDESGNPVWELPLYGTSDLPNPRLFRTRSGKPGFCFTQTGAIGRPVYCGILQE